MINAVEFLEEVNKYRASKGKDLLCPDDFGIDPMSRCIRELDLLIIERILLADRCSLDLIDDDLAYKTKIDELSALIEDAKHVIVNDPDSSWTESLLEYRIRQVHYK